MSNGDHTPSPTPAFIAGKGSGAFRTGRTFDAKGTPNNNLLLSLAAYIGVPMASIGDPDLCTGPLDLLT